MSTTPNVSLEERVAQLQAELDKRNTKGVGAKVRHVGSAILSAFTSPEAVKQEKSLAVLVGVRLAITLGASAATVGTVHQVLKQLGWV